jgi:hypothetical protein
LAAPHRSGAARSTLVSNFVTSGTWSNGNDDAFQVQDERIAPLLSASLFADWHVDSHLKLGARFTWTHWLLAPWERCEEVAFGACTLPSAGHFDVNDALWTWQLGAAFLFGGQH